jgi:hypothetical protein
MIIDDLKKKHSEINLIFIHGVGDCIMFLPTAIALNKRFPNLKILTISGQEKLFRYFGIQSDVYKGEIINNQNVYSKVINFPMPRGGLTKNDTCCSLEIGIDNPTEIYPRDNCKNIQIKIIGVGFFNTSTPSNSNATEKDALLIWNSIKSFGFIPVEVHFIHTFSNPLNVKYKFIDFTTREMKCDIDNLFNIIVTCRAFIGVGSGPALCSAMLLGLDNLLYLERDIKSKDAIKSNHNVASLNNFKIDDVNRFLKRLK